MAQLAVPNDEEVAPPGLEFILKLLNEILNQINSYLDPVCLAVLSVTCKTLRSGLLNFNFRRLALDSYAHVANTDIPNACRERPFHELLREFMKRGEVPRFYAGDYKSGWKFVSRDAYTLVRDLYWAWPLAAEGIDSNDHPEDLMRRETRCETTRHTTREAMAEALMSMMRRQ